MTVKIPLTQNLVALVDDADAPAVGRFKWFANRNGLTHYARRTLPRSVGKAGAKQAMHAFLTGNGRTDHINGDGLDNRRVNLRAATQAQNIANTVAQSGCASRFKGVARASRSGHWRAHARADGKVLFLGEFREEHDAALAYDTAARRLFGEFAALNFPSPGERSAFARGVGRDVGQDQIPTVSSELRASRSDELWPPSGDYGPLPSGDEFRASRLKVGLSQREVADHLGVGRPRISYIETSAGPAEIGLRRRYAAYLADVRREAATHGDWHRDLAGVAR